MFTLPPIPSWQGLHPLIVHFPIALLLIAPLLVLIGAVVNPERARPYLYSALLLMLIGTTAIYFAVETGEAAGKLAERSPEINPVLEHHQHLAERTRMIFTTLSVFFAMIVILPAWLKQKSRLVTSVGPIVFLLFYMTGVLSLVNTAHKGGRLVHEFGVHALVAPTTTPPTPPQVHEAEGSHGD